MLHTQQRLCVPSCLYSLVKASAPLLCDFRAQQLRLSIATDLVVGWWGWACSPTAGLQCVSCTRCCTGRT